MEYCDDTGDCYGSEEIAVVGIDGTGHGYLTSDNGRPDHDPGWSPAGDKVVFTSLQFGLRTVNPNTGMITTLPMCCSDPSWSPDATKIAYTRYVGTTSEVFVANADGSGETRLTGLLDVRLGLRITDKLAGVSATVEDTTLSAPAQCVETPDPAIGGHCTLVTTADALAAGTVSEGKRTVWELDAVRVYHGSTPFAVQGLLVP